jgi:tungstate transport system substrate-binding protein
VSRGDRSGNHLAELDLWKSAGVAIEQENGACYQSIGQGTGAALNFAAASGSYIFSDRATWMHFGNKGALRVVVEGDRRLFNQYGVMLVNPVKHPNVESVLGERFIDYFVSPESQRDIGRYQIDGRQLFRPNLSDPAA